MRSSRFVLCTALVACLVTMRVAADDNNENSCGVDCEKQPAAVQIEPEIPETSFEAALGPPEEESASFNVMPAGAATPSEVAPGEPNELQVTGEASVSVINEFEALTEKLVDKLSHKLEHKNTLPADLLKVFQSMLADSEDPVSSLRRALAALSGEDIKVQSDLVNVKEAVQHIADHAKSHKCIRKQIVKQNKHILTPRMLEFISHMKLNNVHHKRCNTPANIHHIATGVFINEPLPSQPKSEVSKPHAPTTGDKNPLKKFKKQKSSSYVEHHVSTFPHLHDITSKQDLFAPHLNLSPFVDGNGQWQVEVGQSVSFKTPEQSITVGSPNIEQQRYAPPSVRVVKKIVAKPQVAPVNRAQVARTPVPKAPVVRAAPEVQKTITSPPPVSAPKFAPSKFAQSKFARKP